MTTCKKKILLKPPVMLRIYLFIYCFILFSGLWAPSQSEDGTTLEYTIQYRLWTVVTPVYDTFSTDCELWWHLCMTHSVQTVNCGDTCVWHIHRSKGQR